MSLSERSRNLFRTDLGFKSNLPTLPPIEKYNYYPSIRNLSENSGSKRGRNSNYYNNEGKSFEAQEIKLMNQGSEISSLCNPLGNIPYPPGFGRNKNTGLRYGMRDPSNDNLNERSINKYSQRSMFKSYASDNRSTYSKSSFRSGYPTYLKSDYMGSLSGGDLIVEEPNSSQVAYMLSKYKNSIGVQNHKRFQSPKFRIPIRHETPGPGFYQPKPIIAKKIPSFGRGGRPPHGTYGAHAHSVLPWNNTPGPGHYDQESIFKMKKRSLPSVSYRKPNNSIMGKYLHVKRKYYGKPSRTSRNTSETSTID